jgi:hypothetical protein
LRGDAAPFADRLSVIARTKLNWPGETGGYMFGMDSGMAHCNFRLVKGVLERSQWTCRESKPLTLQGSDYAHAVLRTEQGD